MPPPASTPPTPLAAGVPSTGGISEEELNQNISAVSETLAGLIRDRYPRADFGPALGIELYQTRDFEKPMDEGFSIYLYRVSINGNVRNLTHRRSPDGKRFRPSLPVDLPDGGRLVFGFRFGREYLFNRSEQELLTAMVIQAAQALARMRNPESGSDGQELDRQGEAAKRV